MMLGGREDAVGSTLGAGGCSDACPFVGSPIDSLPSFDCAMGYVLGCHAGPTRHDQGSTGAEIGATYKAN